MRYALLIYSSQGDDTTQTDPDSPEAQAEMKRWFDYTNELRESGVHQAGEALLPTTTATTVRNREGDRLVTDGPFAETKEQLGGFYLIDVPDLDAAIGWAAKCPGADNGSIEVRPIMEFDDSSM